MKNINFNLLLSAIFLKGIESACPGETTKSVHGYRFWRVDNKNDFDDSKAGCVSGDGYNRLAIIRSNESSKAVNSIISGCPDSYYFGLQYTVAFWIWQGINIALTEEEARWDVDEGTNIDTSQCACVSENELWIDEPCSNDHPYICERDLLSIGADNDEIWTFLFETANITLEIRSDDGPVNISIYQNNDSDNAIDTAYNVTDSSYTYVVENVTAADNGTYTFVASREGYSRSTISTVFAQDRAAIVSDIPAGITTPVTRGPTNISCVTKGIPTPETYWAKDGIPVNGDDMDSGVYQITMDFSAVLYFDDAISSDDGIYTCVVKNLVRAQKDGELHEEYISDTEETKLRVFGNPTIVDVALTSCPSGAVTIDVLWMPNNQTLGINHVIEVKENTNVNEAIRSMNGTIETDGIVGTNFSGLSSNVTYVITVTVCPDDCIDFLNDSSTFIVIVPKAVTDANVTENSESDTTFCEVRWSFSDSMLKGDSYTFKVIETSTKVRLREPSDQEQDRRLVESNVDDGYCYKAITNPNHYYTFDIYVSNCAGNSTITRAEGHCSVDVTGPDYILPLTVDKSANDTLTTRTMIASIPNELNGPISCLFIIVQPGEIETGISDSLATLQDLSDTATSSTSSPDDGEGYIAVAIPMYRVYQEKTHVIVLGENQASSCDVYQISNADQSVNRKFEAFNWELQSNMKYRVYMLSATPGTLGVFFTQSNETEIFREYVSPKDSIWWIVLPIVAAAMIVAFVILAVLYYIKTFKETTHKKHAQDDPYETVHFANGNSSSVSALTATTDLPSRNASTPLSATAVLVPDLSSVFRSFSENEGETFSAEFKDLKQKTESFDMSADVGSSAGVKNKNRYKNVLPYDHSRVCLVGGRGSDIESYINASYINGFERQHKFIASQGPLATTISDFWKMVMQEKSKVIVMATNLSENAKKKCECYWPDSTAPQVYGNVTVCKVSERKIGGYMKREFELSDHFGSHSVVQLQLLNWPDHGVPISTSTFLRIYKACIDIQGSGTEPIIVHCSAGAGRTGTFIAYDYLIHQAAKENSVDIFECVLKMRAQRMDMVQNCDQYKFIYRLLAEFHIIKETDVDADAFHAKPSLHNPSSNDLQNQLKTLDLAASFPRIAADKVSFQLNVSVTWRPEDGETIARFDAVKIETYEDSFHLIASAPPTKSTAETFWRLNLDNDVSYIVSISDPTMQSRDNINDCWPSEDSIKREFGSLTVELKVAEEKRHFHIRDLFVRRDSSLQTKEIRHYKMIKWRPKVVLNIIQDIKRSCEVSPRSKVPRVLVHCRRGFGETGSFCALVNLIARMETERRVDVLRAVKDLKDANIRLVEDTKQYKFCYDALKSYDRLKSRRNTGGMTNPQSNSAYQIEPLTTTL